MALTLAALLLLSSASEVERPDPRDTWKNNAMFFAGVRSGVGFSPGGLGPSPTFGLEVGISNRHGVGFGLHLLSSTNPQALPALNIPKATYAFGGAADLRIYIQTVNPLTLYPTISLGFITGPSAVDGVNVVLPLFNLGFGARVRFGPVYLATEIGLASLHIPFVSLALGYESKARYEPPDDDEVAEAPPPTAREAREAARPPPPPKNDSPDDEWPPPPRRAPPSPP